MILVVLCANMAKKNLKKWNKAYLEDEMLNT